MSISGTYKQGSGQEWVGDRAHALSRLAEFMPEVSLYASRRNYALPDSPGVSRLSPYLRYRIISEEEVISSVLSAVDFSVAEKFIQEVVWRTYWKGALNANPGIWDSYKEQVVALTEISSASPWGALYDAARARQTPLPYFNEWVNELISTGYLHNHVRMWFASIWIFTFKIPWQLGAAFMYHHLLDGDPASNTLSWRWVAGLHTKGKTYLARADNIAKYSEGRWNPKENDLAAEPFRVEDEPWKNSPDRQTGTSGREVPRMGLVVTTDDLSIEQAFDIARYSSVCLYNPSSAEASTLKQKFVREAADDFRGRVASLLGDERVVIATSLAQVAAWHEAQKVEGVAIVTPQVGPLSSPARELTTSLVSSGLCVLPLQRTWDHELFPLCDKGFFTMWERFKKRWERGVPLSGMTTHHPAEM